jgi:hypothetical protein
MKMAKLIFSGKKDKIGKLPNYYTEMEVLKVHLGLLFSELRTSSKFGNYP